MMQLPFQTYGYNPHNLNQIYQRIDDILNDYANILIIRVDFYIRKEFNQEVERDFMVKALVHLRNNMRWNQTIFSGYISYIAKLEYTLDRGWHYHMAFIFDGAVRQKEYHIAEQILGYWEVIIAGMIGDGNIAYGERYPINGTGKVHWNDTNKINAVKYALSYLAKNDIDAINKTFVDSMGRNLPSFKISKYQPKESNRGRPRL